MATLRVPKGVGYWGEGEGPSGLPRPQSLVRTGWQANDLNRIAAYLRGGHVFGAWCGLAGCRFTGCGQVLGSCDLTDGEWVWPQGLEHYLLQHAVCLPDAFVATMRANAWELPAAGSRIDLDRVLDAGGGPFGDLSDWIAWAWDFTPPVRAERSASPDGGRAVG
jgi:hypothetical protein